MLFHSLGQPSIHTDKNMSPQFSKYCAHGDWTENHCVQHDSKIPSIKINLWPQNSHQTTNVLVWADYQALQSITCITIFWWGLCSSACLLRAAAGINKDNYTSKVGPLHDQEKVNILSVFQCSDLKHCEISTKFLQHFHGLKMLEPFYLLHVFKYPHLNTWKFVSTQPSVRPMGLSEEHRDMWIKKKNRHWNCSCVKLRFSFPLLESHPLAVSGLVLTVCLGFWVFHSFFTNIQPSEGNSDSSHLYHPCTSASKYVLCTCKK